MPMNEQIDMIIAKKLSGEASEEDMRALNDWLAADGENKAEYDQVTQLWNDADTLLKGTDFDSTAAWSKVSARTVAVPPAKRSIVFPAWGKYAIAAAALLLLGIFLFKPYAGGERLEMVIADAGNKEVVLPDQSHVTLRKGSKLRYPKAFASATRNVTLEGEAFFEVTRNEQQPFVIDAQSVSVKVLGTSFNVKCDASSAKVTVATGKVQMAMLRNPSEYIVLTRGEYGTLADSKLTERISTDDNYMFWKTGVLQYENKPLRAIADELSYYYQTTLVFDSSGSQDVTRQLINISFKNQPINKVLDELCLVAQCKWQQKDNQYIISAK